MPPAHMLAARNRWVLAVAIQIALLGLNTKRLSAQAPPSLQPALAQRALLDKYCVTCHSDKLRTGGLSLQRLDLAGVPGDAETWEKVIRKLNVGAMPPQGMPRPDKTAIDGLTSYLEGALDRAYAANPNPGPAAMHRL